jgi:iron(III) transport system permease protein
MRVRGLAAWLGVAWVAFVALPWNAIAGQGFFAFNWLSGYPAGVRVAPAAFQLVHDGRLWLSPLVLALALATFVAFRRHADNRASGLLIAAGAIGLGNVLAVALMIDIGGWTWRPLAAIFGDLPGRQPGLGYGAAAFASASLMFLCRGLALRGWAKGDPFIAGAIGASVALVGLFTLYPLLRLFVRALQDREGHLSFAAFSERLATSKVWGIGGVVTNTLQLGLMTALAATLLALCFALIVTRTRLPGRRLAGVLAVLPMITPPFVIGLALIMLFGRSGAINAIIEWGFGVSLGRWI